MSLWYRLDVMPSVSEYARPDAHRNVAGMLLCAAPTVLRNFSNSPPIFGWDLLHTLFGDKAAAIRGVWCVADPDLQQWHRDEDLASGPYSVLLYVCISMSTTQKELLERAAAVSAYAVAHAADCRRMNGAPMQCLRGVYSDPVSRTPSLHLHRS